MAEQLKVDGKLAAVGGPGYLAQLDQAVPFAQNATEYANIIKNQSTRRLLATAGREILDLATQETGDVAELLDEAERKVFHIAEKRRAGDLRPMSDLMEEALTLLDKMKQSGGGHHRRALGLRRSRQPAHRLPRRRADHPRGPPRHREDLAGDELRAARRGQGEPGRRRLLASKCPRCS